MNVVIKGVGEQVGEGILNAAVGGIIKGQAPNKNGNVLIYSKNWQSSLVKDKRAAIYAGIKGDAQDIDDGKKVWNFVEINVNDAAYSLTKSGYGVRSLAVVNDKNPNEKIKIIKFLLSEGIDVKFTNKKENRNPLHIFYFNVLRPTSEYM